MEISTFFNLHEKSLYLSYYEIFPQKILKSHTFKKYGTLIVKMQLVYMWMVIVHVVILGLL